MATLVMTDPSGREQTYEIGPEPQVWGRGEDSDVVLGSRSVQRHHMRMWEEDGRLMVEDLTGEGIDVDGELRRKVFELAPGEEMSVGVFSFRLFGFAVEEEEPQEEEKQKAPPPLLVGLSPQVKGVEIELQEGDNDIGRDPGTYLRIDDPSVSRLHARLSVGQTCELVDLRSSNGTFVNGKRVERAELKGGEKVRFGNIEFRFVLGNGKPADGKRRKIMLASAGGLVLLVLVLGVALKGGKKAVVENDAVEQQQGLDIELQVAQLLRNAKRDIDNLRWQQAMESVDKALELHPISREAKRMKKLIQAEQKNKGFYEDGITNYDLGKLDEALKAFRKIPATSVYYKKVKYKLEDVQKRLSEKALAEGKSYYAANDFRKAHKYFVEYLDLNPCDRKVYNKWLKKTEAKMRRYKMKYTPYVPICKQQQQRVVEEQDPLEILKTAYPDARIFDAMKKYFLGKGQLAINQLRSLKNRNRGKKIGEKAADLERLMMVAVGKFREGLSYVYQGDYKSAKDRFEKVMEYDSRLMPKGLVSYYKKESGRKLAEQLYKEGLVLFNRDNYSEAFDKWKACLEYDPASTTCKQGMLKLEEVARGALEYASQLAARKDPNAVSVYRDIMTFTRPSSIFYKTAKERLERMK